MFLFHSWRKTNPIVKGVIVSTLCHYQVPALPTRGQIPEAKRTIILLPVERRPQTRKLRQHETVGKYVPNKGTR